MDTPSDSADHNQDQRLANVVSDFQFASAGCLILLGLFIVGALSPSLSQDYSWLWKLAEKFAGYLCITFSSILAFRLYGKSFFGKIQAVFMALTMCSPFFLGEGGVWMAVFGYAIISNSAAKHIRKSGYRIGLTGMVSGRKDSAPVAGSVSQAV